MAQLQLKLLSSDDVNQIHKTSVRILEKTGMKIPSEDVLGLLEGREGVAVNRDRQVATFTEGAIETALRQAPCRFSVFGRDGTKSAEYGGEGFVAQAIPGEVFWVDPVNRTRRVPTWEDFERCVLVADALPEIDIVGAMVQPTMTPASVRDVHLYSGLLKRTRKPVRCWVHNRISARYVVELFKTVSGGSSELRKHPLADFGLEPVSPLQFSRDSLEGALEFAQAGLPITLGPMPLAMATSPVTLAGSVALGNAETLGALVIIETLAPGTAVVYFNSPHIMDPRTMNLVFSSPEQVLMSVASAELGRHYGLPVGVNVGLTDSKVPDAQAGDEKGITMVLGALTGASSIGGMGIAGCDQGFSLPQLIIDNEIIGFVRRVVQGMGINRETCAAEVVERVGIGGSYMTEDHTLDHWRQEFWIPMLTDRLAWDAWLNRGGRSLLDRAVEEQNRLLANHTLEWLEEPMSRELDSIVAAAEREILGT